MPGSAGGIIGRMFKVRDNLARDSEITVPAIILIFVKDLRMDALERLLSAGLLSDSELSGQRKLLAEHRKQLSGIHARTVYGEDSQALSRWRPPAKKNLFDEVRALKVLPAGK